MPSILFLSSHGSVRGPHAEALLRHLAQGRYQVMSAGVSPRPIHPLTRRVLEEQGVDATALAPRSIREFLAKAVVNVAVILGDGGPSGPRIYPFAARTFRWEMTDPSALGGTEAETLEQFRKTRDFLRDRIETWLQELDGTMTAAAKRGAGSEVPVPLPRVAAPV
jgi:arsenate reductase